MLALESSLCGCKQMGKEHCCNNSLNTAAAILLPIVVDMASHFLHQGEWKLDQWLHSRHNVNNSNIHIWGRHKCTTWKQYYQIKSHLQTTK